MRIATYLRVSTRDQTVENQRRELHDWAARSGHEVVAEFADEGVTGSGKRRRPEFEKMLKSATRREFEQLAVWSLDRLGRNMKETVNAIHDLDSLGLSIYLHKQGVDTSTPMGKAFAYQAGIWAEMELEWNRERTRAGLDRARRKGIKLGRPYAFKTDEGKRLDSLIDEMLDAKKPVREIKARLGVGSTRIYRVKNGITASLRHIA